MSLRVSASRASTVRIHVRPQRAKRSFYTYQRATGLIGLDVGTVRELCRGVTLGGRRVRMAEATGPSASFHWVSSAA